MTQPVLGCDNRNLRGWMNLAEGFSLAKKPTATSATQIRLDFYTTTLLYLRTSYYCPRKSRPGRWPGPRLPTTCIFPHLRRKAPPFYLLELFSAFHNFVQQRGKHTTFLLICLFVSFLGRQSKGTSYSNRRSARIVFLLASMGGIAC